MILFVGIALVIGGLLGGIIGWLLTSRSGFQAREMLAAAQARLAVTNEQLGAIEDLRSKLSKSESETATLRVQRDTAETKFVVQSQSLAQIRDELHNQFKLLAGEALKTSSDDLIKRADELFKFQKDATAAEIDKRSKDISDLVKPLGESLKAYDVRLVEIEKSRQESYGGLVSTLKAVQEQQDAVRTVTSNLVNALRAAPKTRGRWGEETLRRVVEMSGLIEHCDFETEKHFRSEDESLRPDMIIHVAGGRSIIVDAKAPVSAYLDAISAQSEEERDILLRRHAGQMRERLKNLSAKSYSDSFHGSIDCVVMFVPGENFVSAAFERDPDLFEDGVKERVLICSPTTFIALTKAISYGWRQDRLAENAVEVGRLGKELYGRLSKFGDHVVDLGRNINSTAKKFNALVGSLENSVMPQARRFNELGVDGTAEALPELLEVDTVVKFPQGGRDLLISGGES